MATGGPPPEGGVPLSPKVKVHYGRLYQIHEWMTQEEQTRVRARIHLFHAVNSLRPGYFNHQVELMDDTTTKYLPCRDFQVGTCNQRTTHCFTKTKANGKKSSIQVIHGCDLCYYGRWDLGFHTINQCHLKHLLPKGTGETPWDRRERKKKEERTPALTTKQRKEARNSNDFIVVVIIILGHLVRVLVRRGKPAGQGEASDPVNFQTTGKEAKTIKGDPTKDPETQEEEEEKEAR